MNSKIILALLITISAVPCAAQTPSASQNGVMPPPAVSPGTSLPSTPKPADVNKPIAPAAVMQLKRQVSGDYSYRFVTPADESAPLLPLPAAVGNDSTVALTLPALANAKDAQLEIVDNAQGKVAHLPVKAGSVTPLVESAFTLVQTVQVPVRAKGQGVYGAVVTLSSASKKYSRSWLLKPTDNGVAQFANVPLTEAVTATVTAGGNAPVSQTLTIPQNTTSAGYQWQPIEVAWPDVKTVAPAPTPMAAPTNAAKPGADANATTTPRESRSGGNGLISTLVSLVVLAGIGYGLYWAWNTGKLKTFLDKSGLNPTTLETQNAVGPQGSPFDKPARAPIQPITEGTAEPLAGGMAGGAVAMASVPSGGPRLVATSGTYSGNIFPIPGRSADIGRDPNNAVPLPNDTNASRRHATLSLDGAQATVTDNGSSNGTLVNGVRIAAQTPTPLRPGDEVQIGLTRFRFENT